MDQLFAPWRIEWVTRNTDHDPDECVFCTLPEADDQREALVIARSEQAYVLLNNSPYNPGHVMVIPSRHTTDTRELTDAELLETAKLTNRAIDAISEAMKPDGFNTGRNLGGAGGGSIPHLHTHVVPRWRGDTNFMAVVDDTKVIVQALTETYDLLYEAFAAQEGATGSTATQAVHVAFD